MQERLIRWGRGSSFNVNIGEINGWGAERYRVLNGKWKFLMTSGSGPRYQHVDNREFHTKEELDTAILEWINENPRSL